MARSRSDGSGSAFTTVGRRLRCASERRTGQSDRTDCVRASMNLALIQESASLVVRLLADYSGSHVGRRETLLDPVLYGYLQGRFGDVKRQYHTHFHGRSHPSRIDFRRGTSNPVVIEFAVRPPTGGGTLYGSQNRSELKKLCRVAQTTARLRVLLLIDLSSRPLDRDRLMATYRRERSGPGNFVRRPVRIVYVQRDLQYNFLWRP